MKCSGWVVLFAVVLLGVPQFVHAEEGKGASASVKIGYVDLNRALNEVEEGKKAKANLETDGREKKQKIEIRQKELQQMKEDLEKQRLVLSADALRQKEQAFQQKLMELQQTGAQYEKEFAEKETNFTKPIGEKLKRIIDELGKSGGYVLILPKEMILYAPPGDDLTDTVIKKYNSGK